MAPGKGLGPDLTLVGPVQELRVRDKVGHVVGRVVELLLRWLGLG